MRQMVTGQKSEYFKAWGSRPEHKPGLSSSSSSSSSSSRQGIDTVEKAGLREQETHSQWRKNNQVPGDRAMFCMLPVTEGVTVDVAIDVAVDVSVRYKVQYKYS